MRRLLLLWLVLAGARADALEDLLTPRGIALGGAARGSATGALGPLLNPASMVLVRQFSSEVSYGYTVQSLGSAVHLSVVDSVTNPRIAAGVYYSYLHASPRFVHPAGGSSSMGVLREGHEAGTSIGIPLGDRFALGFTMKYLHATTEVANPKAGEPMQPKTFVVDSTTASSTDGFTTDIGLVLRLGDSFNLGTIGYNLVPLHSAEAPLGFGVGASILPRPTIVISADARIDFDRYHDPDGNRRTTAQIAGGFEFLAGGSVPLRLGYLHDTGFPSDFISAGLGYTGRSFAIDVAYRQKINGGSEEMVVSSIRLFSE